jgi:predicted protein tyrosine phosphatase
MIHVCSLALLHDTVAATGARHVVSLLGSEDNLMRPVGIAPGNHLWLQLHDINERDGPSIPTRTERSSIRGALSARARWWFHCYAASC